MNLQNQTFNSWTVLENHPFGGKIKCICNCGTIKLVNLWTIKKGLSKSCGCQLKDNYKKTIQDRYGCDNISQVSEIKDKKRETCLERFGETTNLKCAETKDKIKLTTLSIYGVEHNSQSEHIKQKKSNTTMKNYGVTVPAKSAEIRSRMQDTSLERYGVKHAAQVLEFQLKAARSSNNVFLVHNWETKNAQYCVASYEAAACVFLNYHKIQYIFQPNAFLLQNGTMYTPDIFLIKESKYIEIKGFFRKDAAEKWKFFTENHPNSELWDKNKLIQNGILTKSGKPIISIKEFKIPKP